MKCKKKGKILIVEDDNNLLHYYSLVLGEKYSLSCCTHGAKAIQLMKSSQQYDLALIDVRLPDICGLELLRIITAHSPTLPVIMMTAYGDEDVAVKSFHYGAIDYVKKPFGYEELSRKVAFFITHSVDLNSDRKVLYDKYEKNITEKASDTGEQALNQNYYKIQMAIKYIEENYMMKISLSSVADVACTSRCNFSKIFRKAKGITYREYLNSVRIKKAKQLLEQKTSTVTEVAHAIGYDDITNFGRVFKSIVNSTPSEYRQARTENK